MKKEIAWRRTVVAVLALALVSPALFAADRQTHKVIAAPGILDAGAEGIELWHDYSSYALYRVSDAALNQLPPEIRGKVIMSGELDRWWLLNQYHERDADVSKTETGWPADQSAGDPALHHVQ